MRFATFKLIGEAEHWWRSTKAILEGVDTKRNPITWEKFKGVFYDNYFPEVVREQKEKEFADLVQGSMTVEQYVAKFIELFCFRPHLIFNEAKKASRFQKGLNERF